MRALATLPLLGASLLGASLPVSGEARAEPVVRVGGNGLLVAADGAYAGGGNGALSLGYNTENEPFIILPELVGSGGYHAGDFSGANARALLGMRFGFALAVEPTLITRGGYGHYTLGVELPPGPDGQPIEADQGRHGGAFQSGLGLDYRLSRDLTLGGEIVYDLFIDGESGDLIHGLVAGISVAFWL